MIVTPFRYGAEQDNNTMETLIDPDSNGEWAIRYLWVQHLVDNTAFYNNYFDPSLAKPGVNIRKQTANLSKDWTAHNKIFYDSADNGDLVWRVKVANPVSQSIDYVEIWKNVDIVNQHFGHKHNTDWDSDSRKSFLTNLSESGFDVREWKEYPTISKQQAMQYYKQFVEQWKNKQQCIINTAWDKQLNPL